MLYEKIKDPETSKYLSIYGQLGQKVLANYLEVYQYGGAGELYEACRDGHRDEAERLIDRDANVNQVDEHGTTALMIACQNGHNGVAELLLDRGADVGQARPDGKTALMWACQIGHRDVAKLLLDRGADVGQARQGGMKYFRRSGAGSS